MVGTVVAMSVVALWMAAAVKWSSASTSRVRRLLWLMLGILASVVSVMLVHKARPLPDNTAVTTLLAIEMMSFVVFGARPGDSRTA